jgi:hypothetical protein
MKKALLFFLAFTFFSVAHAQINFGVKAGLNLASLPSDFESASAVGFHGGIWAKVGAGPVGFRPELLISTKGGETTVSSNDPTTGFTDLKNDISLVYADVPLLLEFSPVPILKVHLGPQFSFLLSDKVDINDASGSVQNIKDAYDFNSLDLGLVFGLGVTVMKFDAGIRYNLGLSKVSDFNFAGVQNTDFKNSVIQVSIGYKIK